MASMLRTLPIGSHKIEIRFDIGQLCWPFVVVDQLGKERMNNRIFIIKPTLLASLVAVALSGCGESSSSDAGAQFNGGTSDEQVEFSQFEQRDLVRDLVDNILMPAYEQFELDAASLKSSIDSYCSALADAGDTPAALALAQGEWMNAMDTWQQVELMLVGPLADDNYSLRNQIYSWPVTSGCAVDQDVVFFEQGEINTAPYAIADRPSTRRGLDALEYLLFNTNLEHSCANATSAPSGWNERSESERRTARCQFAAEVADDLLNSANTVTTAWAGPNGYANALKGAGSEGSDLSSAHQALNQISNALFYLDATTKDAKLAAPLGLLANECDQGICPESVESSWSNYSIQNIENNLMAFEQLLSGEGAELVGLGFDDFLDAVGAESVAEQMKASIASSMQQAAEIELPLERALTEETAKVEALHQQVKKTTDQLKTEFITNLALEIPSTSAGDND
jgi:predicted lipoprotein